MLRFFLKDRRRQPRETCLIRSLMLLPNGLRLAGTVTDLSRGGCRFRLTQPGMFVASTGAALMLPGARIECAIRRRSGGILHCRFLSELRQATVTAWAAGEDELNRRLAASRLRSGE